MAAINPMMGMANNSCIQKKEAVPAGRMPLGEEVASGAGAGMYDVYDCLKFWGGGEGSDIGNAAVSVLFSEEASCVSETGMDEEKSELFPGLSEVEGS